MYIDNKAEINKLVEDGKFTKDGTCTICGVQIIGMTAQETFEAQEEHYAEHKEISNFTLKVKRSTAKRLKQHGGMGDTVDSLLNKILDAYEKKE